MLNLAFAAISLIITNSGNLVRNPDFEAADSTGKRPDGYELTGSATWQASGYADEIGTNGVSLDSFGKAGAISQTVAVNRARGKWITFRFRAKAEDGFVLDKDGLFMKIDFYHKGQYEDSVKRLVYREIIRDRHDFTTNGNFGKAGAAVWRTYELEELLPFQETDQVKLTVGFEGGAGKDKAYSKFIVDDFELTQSGASTTGKADPADRAKPKTEADATGAISLGGRWFYKPLPGEKVDKSLVVNYANAGRLFYRDDRMVNPFAGNMSGWLRKGYLDRSRNLVAQDRFVQDSVTLTFPGNGTLQILTHNLPNHPTAKFPDTYGTQGYNPGYIQEQNSMFTIPLEPKKNSNALAMTANDSNGALNMGPIGFAVNGVVFFNPFDGNMQDAASLMDRCCGHPNPGVNQYHYHKYPICVNTPFVDKGEGHSPVIGFAFDGFPVYGPYESDGVMAKDLTTNPLNAFNAHYDAIRGWHYHATPGKYPYLLGGYIGSLRSWR